MENIIKLNANKAMSTNVQNQLLNTRNLTSGAGYQRPIESLKIARIISVFNEHKINPIKVSFRDGKYWIFDGQHTFTVLKAMNGGEDCMVWCEVHFGLTYNDEARLFAEQNDNATRVHMAYKMKALYEAEDSETVAIKNIAESSGLQMNFNTCKGDNKLVAVSKVKNIYKSLGSDTLKQVLCLIKQTWGGLSTSLDKEILGGVSLFVKNYKDEFNEDTFVKNLGRIMPLDIKRKGKSDISCKGDLKYANQILDAYNFKLTKKSRLEYKFKG